MLDWSSRILSEFSLFLNPYEVVVLLQVTGELFDHLTCWDALRAALPVGTVSGAPKVWFIALFQFTLLVNILLCAWCIYYNPKKDNGLCNIPSIAASCFILLLVQFFVRLGIHAEFLSFPVPSVCSDAFFFNILYFLSCKLFTV